MIGGVLDPWEHRVVDLQELWFKVAVLLASILVVAAVAAAIF